MVARAPTRSRQPRVRARRRLRQRDASRLGAARHGEHGRTRGRRSSRSGESTSLGLVARLVDRCRRSLACAVARGGGPPTADRGRAGDRDRDARARWRRGAPRLRRAECVGPSGGRRDREPHVDPVCRRPGGRARTTRRRGDRLGKVVLRGTTVEVDDNVAVVFPKAPARAAVDCSGSILDVVTSGAAEAPDAELVAACDRRSGRGRVRVPPAAHRGVAGRVADAVRRRHGEPAGRPSCCGRRGEGLAGAGRSRASARRPRRPLPARARRRSYGPPALPDRRGRRGVAGPSGAVDRRRERHWRAGSLRLPHRGRGTARGRTRRATPRRRDHLSRRCLGHERRGAVGPCPALGALPRRRARRAADRPDCQSRTLDRQAAARSAALVVARRRTDRRRVEPSRPDRDGAGPPACGPARGRRGLRGVRTIGSRPTPSA